MFDYFLESTLIVVKCLYLYIYFISFHYIIIVYSISFHYFPLNLYIPLYSIPVTSVLFCSTLLCSALLYNLFNYNIIFNQFYFIQFVIYFILIRLFHFILYLNSFCCQIAALFQSNSYFNTCSFNSPFCFKFQIY